jgi:hypothetical protein
LAGTCNREEKDFSEMAQGDKRIDVTDFDRSYIRWRIDTTKKEAVTVSKKLPMTLNVVRIALECRVLITERATNLTTEYVLGTSCKTEQVSVTEGIWHQPNADFCVIAARQEFMAVKRWDRADKGVLRYPPTLGAQPERQVEDPRKAFDGFSIDVALRPGRILSSIDEILEVLPSNAPVASHTEYEVSGYHVLIEYPVKTVNYSERERYYQVDTGPVLLPDFRGRHARMIERLRLAYVAHNCPDWTEFIVNVPTPLTDDIKVHHYSQSQRIEGTTNRLIEIL